MDIREKDLEIIASMHISSAIKDVALKTPRTHYRFFLDKVKLFYTFDKKSIILKKDENGDISGILIYTYNEIMFNTFSGPKKISFYIRAIKTLLGLYGFRYKKFITAASSMLGNNVPSEVQSDTPYGKIWVLLVMKEHRREGVAIELLKSCISEMKARGEKTLRVTVKTHNEPAIKVYQKCNFEIIGTCKESSGLSYIMQIEL